MYSDREQELLNGLTEVCQAHHLEVKINELPPEIHEPISLDVEHDEEGGFVGCGIYLARNNTVYYFSDLKLLIGLPFHTFSLICHNGISDLECLRQWGIEVQNDQLYWDTELFSHISDSSRKGYGLKKLAEQDLGIVYVSYDDIVGKRTLKQVKERRTLDKWPIEIVSLYNAMDCFVTHKLYQLQVSMLRSGRETSGVEITQGTVPVRSQPEFYFRDVERPIASILNDMSNRGVRVDLSYLAALKRELEAQKAPLEEAIKNELGNINLNSPKQLLGALNEKEIFPQFKGRPSTDKRALQSFGSNPIVSNLLAYSEIDTLLSSFVEPYLQRNDGIVHPWFNQCGTRTGRPSCSNPNLLQIPRKTENGKRVRRMFIPRDGMLMGDCDYGQIEPRGLAHLSKDPVLCEMFNDGVDFHTLTAERLQISRERAKVLNLSVGYRATFKSVMSQLRCSREEAQQQIDSWWGLFPALRRWQDALIFDAKRSGFCTTLLGRRIRVDGLSDGNSWKREAAERQLINNIAQGSAAEIMKMAMIGIKSVAPNLGLLVQVYDELVFESDNIERDMDIVKYQMEIAVILDVPLVVDCKTGENWAECH